MSRWGTWGGVLAWQARYANFQHEGRQHRQSLQTRSKKEARRRAIRLEAELMNGQFPGAIKVPMLSNVIASTWSSEERGPGAEDHPEVSKSLLSAEGTSRPPPGHQNLRGQPGVDRRLQEPADRRQGGPQDDPHRGGGDPAVGEFRPEPQDDHRGPAGESQLKKLKLRPSRAGSR